MKKRMTTTFYDSIVKTFNTKLNLKIESTSNLIRKILFDTLCNKNV